MVLLHKALYEFVEVGADLLFVGDLIVVFVEVEGVVEAGRSELHSEVFAQLVEVEHIPGVIVRDGDAEAYVLDAHPAQLQQGAEAFVEAALAAAELVVLATEAFDADAVAHLGIALGHLYDAVAEPAAGGEDYAVGFGEEYFDDFGDVLADEGFSAGDVHRTHPRELPEQFRLEFFRDFSRVVPDVAHLATHRAPVGYYYRSVHMVFDDFLFIIRPARPAYIIMKLKLFGRASTMDSAKSVSIPILIM